MPERFSPKGARRVVYQRVKSSGTRSRLGPPNWMIEEETLPAQFCVDDSLTPYGLLCLSLRARSVTKRVYRETIGLFSPPLSLIALLCRRFTALKPQHFAKLASSNPQIREAQEQVRKSQ